MLLLLAKTSYVTYYNSPPHSQDYFRVYRNLPKGGLDVLQWVWRHFSSQYVKGEGTWCVQRPAIVPDLGDGSPGEAAPSLLNSCTLGSFRKAGHGGTDPKRLTCAWEKRWGSSPLQKACGRRACQQGIPRGGESHRWERACVCYLLKF